MRKSRFDIPNGTSGVSLKDIEEDLQYMEACKEYEVRMDEWKRYQENGSDARPPEKPVHPRIKVQLTF